MESYIIRMPDIGEGIAEVEIVEWHVGVGDTVAEDQVLADVMTDKASVEIPSPITGSVVSLGGQVGDILAVGSELITLQPEASVSGIDSESGSKSDVMQAASGAGPEADPGPVAVQAVSRATPEPGAGKATSRRSDAWGTIRQRAVSDSQAGAGAATQAGPGQRDTVTRTDAASGLDKKVLASPSVRQRARQLDIDLHDLAHAGGDTPVSHRDLDEFLMSRYSSGRDALPAIQTAQGDQRESDTSSADDLSLRGDTQINVVGLRRQIAVKMQESKRQIPHFSYIEEIDVTELERLRQTLNDNQDTDQERLTLLPFLVRAMVLAVRRHPEINARYDSEKGVVTRFGAVHMGIATQTENGLMVPVLHDAHSLDLWECASGIRQLTALTRRGKAQRSDLTGSTLTLSSLGSLGGIAATPIINHPEVAIVGVNRIVERPAFQDGQLVSRKMMNLSSSFDHRVVDGMNAAQFIQEVRCLLESPVLLFVRRSP